MEICNICCKNKATFSCNITNKYICKECCNDFQTCQTIKWEEHHEMESKEIIEKLSEHCLSCQGLIRDVSESVSANNIFYFSYNDKVIFHGKYDDIYLSKKRVLLEQVVDKTSIDDLYHLAECYWETGEIDLAIQTLEPIIEKNQYKEVPLLLGKLYKRKGDLRKAETHLKNSLKLDSTYSPTYKELGDLYARENNHINSIFYHEQALEYLDIEEGGQLNDIFFDINYIGLASSYLHIKQYEKVIEYAQEYLKREPTWDVFRKRVQEHKNGIISYSNHDFDLFAHSTLYHLMSLSYLEQENISFAETYIDQALELNEHDRDFNRLKGIIIGLKRGSGQIKQYEDQLMILKQSAELRAGSFSKLRTLTPHEQVILLTSNSNETVQNYIIQKVFNILRIVLKISPTVTPSAGNPAEEDRYTDLFKSHMDAAILDTLGWTTHSQSRAGFTQKETGEHGGIGERDLVIQSQEGNELMIGEALILKGAHSSNINVHTQKIFGYDITSCNFHLIINWGFANNPDKVWTAYKKIVNSRRSGVFPIIDSGETEDLFPNVSTQGLRTFYTLHKTEQGENCATVVHVYVDLRNEDKRTMAEESRNN